MPDAVRWTEVSSSGGGRHRGAVKCHLCMSTSGLTLRDGNFECRDRDLCAEGVEHNRKMRLGILDPFGFNEVD